MLENAILGYEDSMETLTNILVTTGAKRGSLTGTYPPNTSQTNTGSPVGP